MRPDLTEAFRTHLKRQALLCDRLEALADSLPHAMNIQECLYVAQSLLPAVMMAHKFEEEELFPKLRTQVGDISATLERLGYEHIGDEAYATELTHALRDYVSNRQAQNAETLGWMLRGFFEALRRHLAFEQEHVLPLLRPEL